MIMSLLVSLGSDNDFGKTLQFATSMLIFDQLPDVDYPSMSREVYSAYAASIFPQTS